MTTRDQFQAKVDKASINMGRLDEIVNGDDQTVVEVDSGPVPSIAKLLADGLGGRVETLAAIRDGDATGQSVVLATGRDVGGDGFGGIFFYDPLDTTSLDDGGSVVVAIDGKRYKRQVEGSVLPEWYGAVGDDTTDDTGALNACFAAAVNLKKPVLLSRIYRCNDGLTIPPGVEVQGVYPMGEDLENHEPWTRPGCIRLEADSTITLATGAKLLGVAVIEINLSKATSKTNALDRIALFAGTAITINGSDTEVRAHVMGYDTAYLSDGFERSRVWLEHDCANGAVIRDSFDGGEAYAYGYPWYAIRQPEMGTGWDDWELTQRTGVNLSIENCDGLLVTRTYSYGWNVGTHLSDSFSVQIQSLTHDNAISELNENVGLRTRGEIDNCRIPAPHVDSCNLNYDIGHDSSSGGVLIIGNLASGQAQTTQIKVDSLASVLIESATLGGPSLVPVDLLAGGRTGQVTIGTLTFHSSTTAGNALAFAAVDARSGRIAIGKIRMDGVATIDNWSTAARISAQIGDDGMVSFEGGIDRTRSLAQFPAIRSGLSEAYRANRVEYTDVGSATTHAKFTASISGNTMTVTGITQGALYTGQAFGGTGVAGGTLITGFLESAGGVGTYSVWPSQTAASTTMTALQGDANRFGTFMGMYAERRAIPFASGDPSAQMAPLIMRVRSDRQYRLVGGTYQFDDVQPFQAIAGIVSGNLLGSIFCGHFLGEVEPGGNGQLRVVEAECTNYGPASRAPSHIAGSEKVKQGVQNVAVGGEGKYAFHVVVRDGGSWYEGFNADLETVEPAVALFPYAELAPDYRVAGEMSATFSAFITGTTMTVRGVAAGRLYIGQDVSGIGSDAGVGAVTPGTTIIGYGPDTYGGVGTYILDTTQTVGFRSMSADFVLGEAADLLETSFTGSISGTTLTVGAVTLTAGAPRLGRILVGHTLSGGGIASGTQITEKLSGTGGAGTYKVSISQSVTSTAGLRATFPDIDLDGGGSLVRYGRKYRMTHVGGEVIETIGHDRPELNSALVRHIKKAGVDMFDLMEMAPTGGNGWAGINFRVTGIDGKQFGYDRLLREIYISASESGTLGDRLFATHADYVNLLGTNGNERFGFIRSGDSTYAKIGKAGFAYNAWGTRAADGALVLARGNDLTAGHVLVALSNGVAVAGNMGYTGGEGILGLPDSTAPSTVFAGGTLRVDQTARKLKARVAGDIERTVQFETFDSFTVATLPSASPAARMIYVSNESGGAVMAFSDGTNWRRLTDRAIVT